MQERRLTRADGKGEMLMNEISDYQLGHDLSAQEKLLLQAFEKNDEDEIERALDRVVMVRRMKKNGTLEWQAPDFEV